MWSNESDASSELKRFDCHITLFCFIPCNNRIEICRTCSCWWACMICRSEKCFTAWLSLWVAAWPGSSGISYLVPPLLFFKMEKAEKLISECIMLLADQALLKYWLLPVGLQLCPNCRSIRAAVLSLQGTFMWSRGSLLQSELCALQMLVSKPQGEHRQSRLVLGQQGTVSTD